MYPMNNKKFTLLILPLIISGCISLNPDYQRPTGMIPEQVTQTGGDTSNEKSLPIENPDWQQYVSYSPLKTVIETSLTNNKDLKIALANIASAKAQYGITDSNRLPTINVGVSGSKGRNVNGLINESYQADIGLSSFEIDVFGRVKSLSDSALESFLATQATQRATELMIVSETSKAYFNIALAKSQLNIAQQTEKTTAESLEIISKRVQYGVANEKDLSDVQSVYYRAKSDVFNYKTQVEQSINALNLIVGSVVNPALLPDNLTQLKNSIHDVNVVINSDVLYNRPDVIAVEHQLLAANANIGAARAAFFPRISLTTSQGIASPELSNLFSNHVNVWNFAPSISLPIFDYGYNKSNLEYSKAQKDKYIATYEKTVQTAFSEVADVLARKGTIDDQILNYSKFVDATQNSLSLAQKSYDVGVSDYLQVLTAQNTLYDAQKSELLLTKEKYDNLIALYKVIGY